MRLARKRPFVTVIGCELDVPPMNTFSTPENVPSTSSPTLGAARVTVQNLTVHAVDAEKGLILLKGAVPGPNGGLVLVKTSAKKGA